ncbi:flavodoxin domain-containing protein [Streptomyces sp. ST2-7A]|uniref:flavodoxin domain-containing protein n=1 Tax=Streptomyces sp. ST2-7A TaxID=2907214 RepID=UPI001F440BD7|nr:flavodoxin domain-containing protein [Streptomyces sp. ST2-7A]MCE7081006.1 flavodoxin domain-containing protein [Streptomyces sp. ST2-7A]
MIVPVGYASAHGSTHEVAERIASGLEEAGHRVECHHLEDGDIGSPASRDACVVGSAVHNRDWLPGARRWVERYATELSRMPVWMFGVGMSRAPGHRVRARAEQEQERRVVEALREVVRPVGHKVFSGEVHPDHLNPMGRTLFRAMGGRYGYHRDWSVVDAWTGSVAERLAARRGRRASPGGGGGRG